jgi:ATP-dependent Clp protease adaptor protein ClpS
VSEHERSASPGKGVEVEEEVAVSNRLLPPYHVILLNDDDHSFDYVIRMLLTLFGHPPLKGLVLAHEVNDNGRAIVCTTSKERAELKQEQIHAFGADPGIARSKGSMSAVIEPAE